MIGTSHAVADVPKTILAQVCSRDISEVILHHTWEPSIAQYKGGATIQAIYDYHTSAPPNGPADGPWSDIGYHYIVSPDGLLWLGRPLERDGAHVAGRNEGTIGVSMILNGDIEMPTATQLKTTAVCLSTLCKRFHINPVTNFGASRGFHRDYSKKTCPGTKITKAFIISAIKEVDEVPMSEASLYAAAAWDWATNLKLLDGTRPHDAVSREDLAVVLKRFKELP